ncbi:MAG: hypothetical protein KH828_05915 [Clostridiales bacterium]|nr:hypothetical protein [Clostridiales bacterium]
MRKKILCLAMAAVMSLGTTVTAHAEHFEGSSDWKVEFDGDKMNSNFESSAMSEEIYKLLPGDSMELQVSLENVSDGETDWYMTNEILQSLEESQSVAEGGAYTYRLTYTDPDNTETVIYDSETVGGDSAEDGLHEATDSLEDYFYLDRLEKGKSGRVHLTVVLDGETQGNAYQDTLARLQMNFAVEKVTARTVIETGDPVKKVVKKYVTAPKTGDPTDIMKVCAITLVSGVVLLVLGVAAMKKRRNDKKGEQKS